ncbi:MAG TPA: hypothetical protein VGW38_13165 [Chloroflexota bacterium]|nr:hypothetical protein [Chloroflexota bacterium]
MTKRWLMLVAVAAVGAGCGDAGTEVQAPRWADYAGDWRVQANEASPSYHNCKNVNAAEGGIRIRLNANSSFGAVAGIHNGGWGSTTYEGTVAGNLTPPASGTLVLQRPGGSGTLTLTSVTATRMEGNFFALDDSFADPGSGRTPCAFAAVLVRP